MQFSELPLSPTVLRAVEEIGYGEVTPVQAATIPPALAGRDIRAIAQTGTGKTAAFALPMITMLSQGRARARMPRSLVLCPTRELATQVARSFEDYGRYDRLRMALLIGGVSFAAQLGELERGADVLIATPGRLLDHFERGRLLLGGTQIAVIDEADRMLDIGFIPDVERIFRLLPFTRQAMLFSATMPPEIERLASEFLQAPVHVEVAPPATTADNVVQLVIPVPGGVRDEGEGRRRALVATVIREEHDLRNAIVFCNRKRSVSALVRSLERSGFATAGLHGDLDQHLRTRTLDAFRAGEYRILVASDVAARGLDIPIVSHVFNHDVPLSADDYVHRIGRTARAGRSGRAITLCAPSEERLLGRIRNVVGDALETLGEGTAPAESRRSHRRENPQEESAGDRESRSRQSRGGRGRRRVRSATVASAEHHPAADSSEDSPMSESGNHRRRRNLPASRPAPAPKRVSDRAGLGGHLPAFLANSTFQRGTAGDDG